MLAGLLVLVVRARPAVRALLGILLGGAVALVTTRRVAPFLFGLTPADPATWAISALALAAVSMTACALPAWRAARLDPNAVLRAE